MWSNFHTHSNYCDGVESLEQYVTTAAEKSMLSLGFSSHAPLPFENKWCMKPENLGAYLANVGNLKKNNSSLQIYKSLEIDFIPGLISPSDFASVLDYTVGSIHFTDAFADGRHWEIDGHHESFLFGLDEIFKNKIKGVISRYFELTRQMIELGNPTIIGHLDKIKIQNINEKFFRESDTWYVAEIEKTLNMIQRSGAIVEVNTRGIYQKKTSTTYPSPWILQLIHQKDIPITISSDAHKPADLTNQFEETALMLLQIGFKKLSVLFEGKWKRLDFNEQGIIVKR